jgi:hypothetical protein
MVRVRTGRDRLSGWLLRGCLRVGRSGFFLRNSLHRSRSRSRSRIRGWLWYRSYFGNLDWFFNRRLNRGLFFRGHLSGRLFHDRCWLRLGSWRSLDGGYYLRNWCDLRRLGFTSTASTNDTRAYAFLRNLARRTSHQFLLQAYNHGLI